MKKKVSGSKGFIAGFVAAGMIFGTTALAASNSVTVDIANLKFMFNNVEKKQAAGEVSFIYKGTTYVPLRFVSEGLGEKVEYDGKNKAIWVGKRDGYGINLSSKDYARFDAYRDRMWFNESDRSITGTEYRNNILSKVNGSWADEKITSVEYNLDGKYKKLTALVGVEDESKNTSGEYTVTFYGDGEVIKSFEGLKGGDHAIPVDVNLEGVLKLKIEFKAKDGEAYVLVAEPKLFQ
ncbi:NPCBM/NEW2 domain-containing protein [Paenibacillus sp. 11B]|nr:NPCBM/NEW2 domain-containing protein [Paenibacillus sp. 11B]MDN8593223.1 NPCBM/NEW2 domain-containing protein [Paenibacillus sp. 11B]